MNALHLAAYWNHEEAVGLLLDAAAQGWPGAAAAVSNGTAAGVPPSLLATALPSPAAAAAATDKEGRSATWVAAQRGHVELLSALLGAGGPRAANTANDKGATPLRVASAQVSARRGLLGLARLMSGRCW
jgi:ankyrin repeat protein